MKCIVYTRPDGGLSVCHPAPDYVAQFKTEDEGLAAIIAKDVPPDATDVHICERSDIPSDRTFRDAWERGGNGAVVNMEKARTVHMDRIRAVRNSELSRLDVEQLKGNDVTAEKQKLRDIPQTFDLSSAKTPDELKTLWPADLPR